MHDAARLTMLCLVDRVPSPASLAILPRSVNADEQALMRVSGMPASSAS